MNLLTHINRNIDKIPKQVQEYAKDLSYTGVFYCSVVRKHGQLYELVYGIKRTKKLFKIQPVMAVTEDGKVYIRNCYYNWGGCSPGFKSYGYDGRGNSSYYYPFDFERYFDEAVANFPQEKCLRNVVNISDLSRLDRLIKYCSFQNKGLDFISYIRIYRRWPTQAEMLMKFSLIRMISDKNCEKLSKDPYFHRWLERHHEQCKGLSYQMAHNSWKKNPEADPKDYSKSFGYRIEVSKKLSRDNKEIYNVLKQFSSRERIIEYIEDNKINVSSYIDYITACRWLKLNMNDTKVLFPKDFKTMHDNYTKQYSDYQNRERNELIEDTARKFSYLERSKDGYLVKLAHTKNDMIVEGSALKHCVGRMDYDKRMAEGKSVICFIRKADSPTTPFVTAEVKVEKNLRLAQCYGEHDSIVPEVKTFTDWWMKNANKEYKHAV